MALSSFKEINVQVSVTPEYTWSSTWIEERNIIKYTNNELMVNNPFALKLKVINQDESIEIEKIELLFDMTPQIVKLISSVEGRILKNDKIIYDFPQVPLRADYFRDQIFLNPVQKGSFYISFNIKVFPRGKAPVIHFLNVLLEGTVHDDKIVDFQADLMPQTTFLNNEIIYTFTITNFSETKPLRNVLVQSFINENYISENILKISKIFRCQLSNTTNLLIEDIPPKSSKFAVLTLKPEKPALLNLQPKLHAYLNGTKILKPHKPFLLVIEDSTADENLLTKLYDMQSNTPFLAMKSVSQINVVKSFQSLDIDDFYVDPYEQITFKYQISRERDKDSGEVKVIVLDFFIRNNSFQSASLHTVNLGVPIKPVSVKFNSHEEDNLGKFSLIVPLNKVLDPMDSMQLQVKVHPSQTHYFLAPTLTFSFVEPKKFKVGATPQLI